MRGLLTRLEPAQLGDWAVGAGAVLQLAAGLSLWSRTTPPGAERSRRASNPNACDPPPPGRRCRVAWSSPRGNDAPRQIGMGASLSRRRRLCVAHPHHRAAQCPAELRPEQSRRPSRFVGAAQLARLLEVEHQWVLDHARQLGGVRLGDGRGRLRFDVARAQRALACPEVGRAAG